MPLRYPGTFFAGTSGTATSLVASAPFARAAAAMLAPLGEIRVGLASPPAGFSYALPTYPLWALNFGIVTEKGGDLTVVSLYGNIDPGKGAKTVQAIQPLSIVYDVYGNIIIETYAASTGSGLAALRSMPEVPVGNIDLVAIKAKSMPETPASGCRAISTSPRWQ